MLVNQAVVERTGQRQVLEGGAPTLGPEADVVGLGERARAAPWEDASTVAVANLAEHPRRRLAAHLGDLNDATGPILDECLNPRVAQEPLHRLSGDDGTVFDLGVALAGHQHVEIGVDDHGCAIRVRIRSDGGAADGDQGVGSSSGERGGGLTGRRGERARDSVEGFRDAGACGGGQMSFEREREAFVGVPLVHGPFLFGRRHLGGLGSLRPVGAATDGGGGDVECPLDQA